jgi:hypothetical protein
LDKLHPKIEMVANNLELSGSLNLDSRASLSTGRSNLLNGTDDIHTLNDGSKDNVLAIQPGSDLGTDLKLKKAVYKITVSNEKGNKRKAKQSIVVVTYEELGSVGVGTYSIYRKW